MRKPALLLLVLCVVLVALGCSPKKKPASGSKTDGEPAADWPWGDIPEHPKSDHSTLVEWDEKVTALPYKQTDGRFFYVSCDLSDACEFYKSEMPNHGWTGGESNVPREDYSSVLWSHAEPDEKARITVSTNPDDEVRILIMRYTDPK